MALPTLSFDQVLDAVESLPLEDQTALLNILNHRLIDQRRSGMVQNIQQGHQDYAAGNVVSGSVEDGMAALNDGDHASGTARLYACLQPFPQVTHSADLELA
jgi:hypothetical protein